MYSGLSVSTVDQFLGPPAKTKFCWYWNLWGGQHGTTLTSPEVFSPLSRPLGVASGLCRRPPRYNQKFLLVHARLHQGDILRPGEESSAPMWNGLYLGLGRWLARHVSSHSVMTPCHFMQVCCRSFIVLRILWPSKCMKWCCCCLAKLSVNSIEASTLAKDERGSFVKIMFSWCSHEFGTLKLEKQTDVLHPLGWFTHIQQL